MSLVTFLLTDKGKTGVGIEYLVPPAAEEQPTASHIPKANAMANLQAANQNPQSTQFTVTRASRATNSVSTFASTRGRASEATIGGESAINPQDTLYDCPLLWNESNIKPEWLDDALVQQTQEVAQEYAVMMEKASRNLVPKTEQVREVTYRYYYRLEDVAEIIDERSTDIDCTEELLELVQEAMAECLYNIAVSHVLAAFQRIGEMEGDAVRHLTSAAGVFDYVMNSGNGENTGRPELTDDNLRIMSCICMATAHEVSLQYYYSDTYHQVEANSKLAHAASYFYTLAAAIASNTMNIPNREMMLNFLNIKRTFMEGLMLFIMSIEIGTTKGESRRRKAVDCFDECLQHLLRVLPGERRGVEMELAWYTKRCTKFRKIAKKGHLPEGAFSNKRRRCTDYADMIPIAGIVPQYPQELAEFIEILKQREATREERMAKEKERREKEAHDELMFKRSRERQMSQMPTADEVMPAAPRSGEPSTADGESPGDKPTPPKSPRGPSSEQLTPQAGSLGVNDTDMTRFDVLNATSGTQPGREDSIASEAQAFSNVDLSADVHVESKDIRLVPPTVMPSATHYHLVMAMIALRVPSLAPEDKKKKKIGDDEFAMSLTSTLNLSRTYGQGVPTVSTRSLVSKQSTAERSQQATVQQEVCSTCAVVFIVDLNFQKEELRSAARSAVAFGIRCARLTEQDRVGIVTFDRFGEPKLAIFRATDENLLKIVNSLLNEAPRGKFEGNYGPYMMRAIKMATEALDELGVLSEEELEELAKSKGKEAIKPNVYTGNRNVVIVTDGHGNAMPSDVENWLELSTPEVRQKLIDGEIPIHTYATSDAADHEFLCALSKFTRGNHGTSVDFDEEDGVYKLRRWIAGLMSGFKQRVASKVEAHIECPSGVLIANVFSDYYTPPPTTQYNRLKGTVDIPLLPLSAEQETHVLVTFAVPTTASKRDVIDLGKGFVKYFDAIRQNYTEKPLVFKNVCSHRILSREIHTWVNTVSATDCKGPVHLLTPTACRTLIRGSELVFPNDTVNTGDKAYTTLVSLENTRLEIKSNSVLRMEEISLNKLSVFLSRGQVNIVSADMCEVTVNMDDIYRFDICPGSCVSISYDKAQGEMTTNCVVGNVKITMLEVKADATQLYAPRQTTARVPEAPILPWIVNEKTFFMWIVYDNETSRRLKNTIRVETHLWRTKCAAMLQKIGRFMRRSKRSGTLTNDYAYTLCRQIMMHALLTRTKLDISNSIAYFTTNKTLDKLRKTIEDVLELSTSKRREYRTWNDVYTSEELAVAIGWERSIGGSKVYATSDQEDQCLLQLSSKARFMQMLSEERERQAQEALAAANQARTEALLEICGPWDFGAVNRIEVRNMLTVVYDMPNIRDAMPRLDDILVCIGVKKAMTDAQYVTVLLQCAEELGQTEFALASRALLQKVQNLAKAIEADRVSRSLFAIFLVLDETSVGYIKIPDLVSILTRTFGDNLQQFKRVDALTKRLIEYHNENVQESAKSLVLATVKEEQPYWKPATVDNDLETVKVTLALFLRAMPAFFEGLTEQVTHQQLSQIRGQIDIRNKLPGTTEGILKKQRQEEEKQHLITWDLRHIFDGIEQKNIARLTDPDYVPEDEELLQKVCAPVCLLANIQPPIGRRKREGTVTTIGSSSTATTPAPGATITRGVETTKEPTRTSSPTRSTGSASTNQQIYTDYWAALRTMLKNDWKGLFRSLNVYPALSITHRQALRVTEYLKDPRLEPAFTQRNAPVLGSLLSWLRLILRIAYLVHNYDEPPVVADQLLSEAVATQKKAMSLAGEALLPSHMHTIKVPRASEQAKDFSLCFSNVYEKTPPVGYGNITTFSAEPPSGKAPLGKPLLRCRPGGRPVSASGPEAPRTSELIASSMTPDNTKMRQQKALRDNGEDNVEYDGVPTESPQQSQQRHRSVVSFRGGAAGQHQRLDRQKSETTTRRSSTYLQTEGCQIKFGPSQRTGSTVSAHSYMTGAKQRRDSRRSSVKSGDELGGAELASVADSETSRKEEEEL